jgi:hypothetical protein
MATTRETKRCTCGASVTMSRGCGAFVCEQCDHHIGLVRCYCGWSADGGDGYAELIEMGETIEPEEAWG